MGKQANYIYQITNWVMKIVLLNLLWIIFNSPVIFLLLNAVIVKEIEDVFVFILPVVICIPLFFFPATIAMFAIVHDWVINKEVKRILFSQYFIYYKKYYKEALLFGVLFVVVWIIIGIDIMLFIGKSNLFIILFMSIGALSVVFMLNLFSVKVHLKDTLFTSLKNASLITISSPVSTITILFGFILLSYISIYMFQFSVLLYSGSLLALLSFHMYYRFYEKTQHNQP